MILISVSSLSPPLRTPADVLGRLKAMIPSLAERSFLVLNDSANPVGMVSLDVFGKEVELHEIYISREFRAQGYGTKVLRAVDQLLIEEGCSQLWLYPNSTDGVETDALVRWYTRCGFIPHPSGEGMVKYYR